MNKCEMTMKHVALGLLALTGVCAYGDSVFSDKGKDGDIANAANWSGGVMPDGSTTVVLRPDWSGSPNRTEYILSSDVSFGKLEVSNFKKPAFLDLMQHAFSAASFVVWGNPDPFSFTNGTLTLAAGFTVDADSAAAVGPDVSLTVPTGIKLNPRSKLTMTDSSVVSLGKVLVDSGAQAVIGPGTTVTMPQTIETEGLVLNDDAKLTIDGGTFNVPSISGGWSLGNRLGTWGKYNATLEIKNGGKFVSPNAGRNQFTLFHSTLLMADGMFDLSNGNNTDYDFMTGDGSCRIAATNSTFNFKTWQVGGSSQCGLGCWNGMFNFVGSSVGGTVSGGIATSDMTFYHAPSSSTPSRNNVFTFDNCTTAVNFKFGGVTNSVCVNGGTKSGQVILDGTANGLYVTNGTVNATEDRFQFKGTDSVAEFSGAQTQFSKINGNNKTRFVSGSNLSLRVKDGAKAFIGYYGDAEMMGIADAVEGMTISVDNATLTTEGYLDMTAKGAKNVVFEMRGDSPTWLLKYWQTCRRALLTFGRKGTLTAAEAPRIRFVLPKTPYAQAPIRTAESWFVVVLTSTARLEIDLSECGESETRRVYPLIKGAYRDADGDGLNAARLAELTANSNLPEGCHLQYDASTHTLSLVKRSNSGLTIVIR